MYILQIFDNNFFIHFVRDRLHLETCICIVLYYFGDRSRSDLCYMRH